MIRTAFLDLLFNTALAFVALFVLAFLHMRPPAAAKALEPKAEFVLEMTWPDGSLDDMDLWLLLPDGQKVGFNRKDTGVATLDRDDRGAYGDVYYDGEQRRIIRQNKEVVALRAIQPGRHVVNVHYYNRFTEAMIDFPDEWRRPDVPVRVRLTKLNPRVSEVAQHEVTLYEPGEQATALAFELDADGRVTAVDSSADLPFVEVTK